MFFNALEMTARVENLEGHLVPPPADEERAAELAALRQNQASARHEIAMLERNMAESQAELESCVEKRAEVESGEGAPTADPNAEHRIQHSIQLYATISGIRWDYSKDKEDRIAGVINLPNNVRAFDLDSKMSDFEITESLWDMIDPQ